ncbi:MAG: aminodeoxychorismate synthase component I [bacterium]|nr:aminodeoxychorismate synthase component I [bacterium]
MKTIRAVRVEEVLPAVAEIESAAQRGLYAAGFLSYEAAPAFDTALVTRPAGSLPLLWFGIYKTCEKVALPDSPASGNSSRRWQATLDLDRYRSMVSRIRERIAHGDTYQVNFTWRLRTAFTSAPWPFFLDLVTRDRTRYAAFVDTGEHAVCSFSPELFFRLDGSRLTCRPMKGTSRRGLYRQDDRARSRGLRDSVKNRAENVMIVDMVRNDLGRVALPGSVETSRLFDIETYPTVLQMTSTVQAKTESSFLEIMTALFPSSSITGAPKVETMKIIAEFEEHPRGVYTGAIGYLGPNRQALFNVAIRTAHVDRSAGTAEYGTGGGIVWDSEPDAEYLEGRAKTLVLAPKLRDVSLLETMRWSREEGYYLLRRHLDRLADSADFLGFAFAEDRAIDALEGLAESLPRRSHRVRLLLSHSGLIDVEADELEERTEPWTIGVAHEPIDPGNRFLYHKTTAREVYDSFRRSAPDLDDVLLWNPAGELTETTLANIALQLDGNWLTPPVACGLLAGTLRAELLESGRIRERVLTLHDLGRADSIALLNSVRGWIPAGLATTREAPVA